MQDRLFINEKNKKLIDNWKKNKVLDFDESVSNMDIFLLAASLGVKTAKSVENKYGFVREEYIKPFEIALLASISLGSVIDDNDIDESVKSSRYYKIAENCAESGFNILNEKINKANGDNDLLRKQLMSDLDLLFESVINKELN